MCNCFRDRAIEVEERLTLRGTSIKTYQFVRSHPAESQFSRSNVFVHYPSAAANSRRDTSHASESASISSAHSDDDTARPRPQPFHPLPPIIHQPLPPQQQIEYQYPFGALQEPALHDVPERLDDNTLIIGDNPERAVARLPKRVVRIHRRPHQQHRSSSRRSRTRSSGGRYYYSQDGSHGSSNTRGWDEDSWADGVSGRGNGQSEWGEWLDGGDSWDDRRRPDRGRQIEGGRTRRNRSGRRGIYLT